MSEELKELIQRQTNKDVLKAAFKEALKEWITETVKNGKLDLADKILFLCKGAIVLGILWAISWSQGWFK